METIMYIHSNPTEVGIQERERDEKERDEKSARKLLADEIDAYKKKIESLLDKNSDLREKIGMGKSKNKRISP